jgi:hypothetical protein
MGALRLDAKSSLMSKVEATTCNCYNVDIRVSPHEAPIPCAFEIPSTSPPC